MKGNLNTMQHYQTPQEVVGSGQNPQSLKKESEKLIEKENFEIHPDGTNYSGQMKIFKRDDGSGTQDMIFIPHG